MKNKKRHWLLYCCWERLCRKSWRFVLACEQIVQVVISPVGIQKLRKTVQVSWNGKFLCARMCRYLWFIFFKFFILCRVAVGNFQISTVLWIARFLDAWTFLTQFNELGDMSNDEFLLICGFFLCAWTIYLRFLSLLLFLHWLLSKHGKWWPIFLFIFQSSFYKYLIIIASINYFSSW